VWTVDVPVIVAAGVLSRLGSGMMAVSAVLTGTPRRRGTWRRGAGSREVSKSRAGGESVRQRDESYAAAERRTMGFTTQSNDLQSYTPHSGRDAWPLVVMFGKKVMQRVSKGWQGVLK
jgi:hypothetical protein